MKYVIDSKVYENHINDEVHLYGLLHQLAFLAEKAKDEKDLENLAETSKRYGEIAEEKFDDWLIPGRYLVFGDRTDLAELKAAELTPLTAVLKEHDARIREKQRAAPSNDPAYIISGSAFRMLVGDLFDLLAQYSFLRNRVLEVKTERQLARLQKNLSGENPSIRRMYRRWGFAEDQVVTCYDILEATLRCAHLTPYDPEEAAEDGIGCGRCYVSCYDGAHQAISWDKENRKPSCDHNKCVGCHLCALVCPVKAIGKGEIVMKPGRKGSPADKAV